MSRKELEDYEVIQCFLKGFMSRCEASRRLGISERAVTNRGKKIRLLGLSGVFHGNKGRKPKIAKSQHTKHRYLSKKREQYADFNVHHAWELIREDAGESEVEFPSYETFYRWCQKEGLLKFKQRRRRKPRKLRERMPMRGMMLQMDGSHHDWFGTGKSCLLSAIDDATNEITARFYSGETTLACLDLLYRIIKKNGVPELFYIDRAMWGGGAVTQSFSFFEDACRKLDIRIAYANSAEAKGRIERSHRTHQDRLVPLLKRQKTSSLQAANKYLENVYLKEWETKFTVLPALLESRFRKPPSDESLREILCVKEHREARGDSTIHYCGVLLNVRNSSGFAIHKGAAIEIRQRFDGTWKAFYNDEPLVLSLAPANRQHDHRFLQKLPPGNMDLDREVERLTNGKKSLQG